ncbi:Trp biosynthesis-associated membrane protein [Herbiconiux daphne]|uniref:Trp biosynthesis-associated membrane protein n=1 Tax=Herbiconiux daphne TaxID=2970914 RepID=A0ABT2GZ92_9MICO|nr:Trp biosynthesis-associated membrane protein [Herbiconiux daphne]MCS5733279.1 Trp biosynthesis-associated membrane protein [Herbiconiux daphne]
MSEAAAARTSGRRVKFAVIVAVLLLSALTFLAWSQSWGSLTIVGGTTTEATLDVPGSVAAPALSALGLAGIALAGALAIAGPVIRTVLGALEVLLGASVLWSGIGALTDPVGTGASVVTTSTGVAGTESIRDLVTVGATSPWPAVTVVLGAGMVLVGLVVVITVRRWPAAGRKYQAVTFEGADGRQSSDPADFFDEATGTGAVGDGGAPDSAVPGVAVPDATAREGAAPARPADAVSARDAAVDDWDSLTHGEDPTR